jgi:hypothetical protein
MLRRITLLRTDVSEERIASIIIISFSVLQLVVSANFVPSSLILFTLMMEAIRSFEMSLFTIATQRHILEDGIPYLNIIHPPTCWSSCGLFPLWLSYQ